MFGEKVILPKHYREKVKLMRTLPFHIEWDDIKVGDKFHLPPILVLSRKDIEVTSINESELEYKVVGDAHKNGKFARRSLFSRFLTRKKL